MIKSSKVKKEISSDNRKDVAAGILSKVNSLVITMRSLREMAEKEAKLIQFALKDMENNLIDPKHILELTKSIHGTGERSVTEYINRNTEILLNEHSSIIRQQVIEKMKKQMQDMREELTLSAQKFESNFSSFFQLIETSYKNASESFQKVIALTRMNVEKESMLHDTQSDVFSLQSEVQSHKEVLLECLMCYAFLATLFPGEITENGAQQFLHTEFLKSFGPAFDAMDAASVQQIVLDAVIPNDYNDDCVEITSSIPAAADVIKVIDRLKDSNLSLLHNSHLKFETQTVNEAKDIMESELRIIDAKIESIQKEIDKAKSTADKLKKQFSDLEENEHDRDAERRKLNELYVLCTGSKAQNVDVYLMKSAIDNHLEDLLEELNKYPRKRTKEMLKVLETEKKMNEKKAEEALRAERLEKRLQRAGKGRARKW